ncbi:MAG TPA: hypothetical protein VIM73_01900 [Polyangiaceae bacterium]
MLDPGVRRLLRDVRAASPICVLLWASPATASPTARLEYSRGPGAETCPDQQAVTDAVAQRLGYDPFVTGEGPTLRAHVERSGERFVGVLVLDGSSNEPRAERRLESTNSCAELISALALSMSIVIDPERAASSSQVESEPQKGATGEQASPADTPPASRAVRTAPRPVKRAEEQPARVPQPAAADQDVDSWTLRAGVGGHLSFGAEPSITPGASAMVGARLGKFSIAIEGRYDAPADAALPSGGQLEIRMLGLELVPCAHKPPFMACAVGLIGSMRAESLGVPDGDSDTQVFAAAGVRAGLELPLGAGIALRAYGDALGSARPLSARRNGASVWDTPLLTAAVSVGALSEF